MNNIRTGGYDDGYEACPCFWGRHPSSLVRRLVDLVGSPYGWRVLDAGCGEGKNAVFLGNLGARVRAVDISPAAIRNATREWGEPNGVSWEIGDILELDQQAETYDLVVMYGLLHCLPDESAVKLAVREMQRLTRNGGFNVLCAFNGRSQDLSAHPQLQPTLLSHDAYLELYRDWRIVEATDTDLHETHPNNGIAHTHSMTRVIAQLPDRSSRVRA